MDKLEKKYTKYLNDMEAKHKEDMERLQKKHMEDIKSIEKKYAEGIKLLEKKHAENVIKTEKNTQDIAKTGASLKKLKDSIELKQDKKGHSDDIEKIKQKQSELETKHDEDKKKQDDEITKVTTICTEDIKELRDEEEIRRTAKLGKEARKMSTIRSKHIYDIHRLGKKHNDSKQLPGKYIYSWLLISNILSSRKQSKSVKFFEKKHSWVF